MAFDPVKHAYERGLEYPYGGRRKDEGEPDWATRAALAICWDLSDRAGIKHEMGAVERDIQREIVEAMASYIRYAHQQPQPGGKES